MAKKLSQLWFSIHNDRGEVYVEYVVLAGLAMLVILGSIQYFFGGISDLFTSLGGTVRGIDE
jgi:Flp pilus assembly pilin Flp